MKDQVKVAKLDKDVWCSRMMSYHIKNEDLCPLWEKGKSKDKEHAESIHILQQVITVTLSQRDFLLHSCE